MPRIARTETFETTDEDFNLSEIENLKTIIYEYSKAIKALVSGRHASYQLDTGQSIQRVTRNDLQKLVDTRRSLIDELEARQSQAGNGRPAVAVYPEW